MTANGGNTWPKKASPRCHNNQCPALNSRPGGKTPKSAPNFWLSVSTPRVRSSLFVLAAERLLIERRSFSHGDLSHWNGHLLFAVVRSALIRGEPAQIEARQVLGPEGFFF